MQKLRLMLLDYALVNVDEKESNLNTLIFHEIAIFEEELKAVLPNGVESVRITYENGNSAVSNKIKECKLSDTHCTSL